MADTSHEPEGHAAQPAGEPALQKQRTSAMVKRWLCAGKKGWGSKLLPAAAKAEGQLRSLWDKRRQKGPAPHLAPYQAPSPAEAVPPRQSPAGELYGHPVSLCCWLCLCRGHPARQPAVVRLHTQHVIACM